MWRRISLFLGRLLLCVVAILIVVDAWVAYSQPMYYAESVREIAGRSWSIDGRWKHNRGRIYAQLMMRNSNIEQAADRLGYSLDDIQGNKIIVTAVPKENTLNINILVGSTSPELSAQMANAIPTTFVDKIEEAQVAEYAEIRTTLQSQLDELTSQIEQTNFEIDSYLKLGDNITLEESTVLARLQNKQIQYKNNFIKVFQSVANVHLAQVRKSEWLELAQVATIPTSPRQSIFFDLFNSVVHMKLVDRFIR